MYESTYSYEMAFIIIFVLQRKKLKSKFTLPGSDSTESCWENTIKNKIPSQLRDSLHKGRRERKQFYYWIIIKSECDTHHKHFVKRLQRQKEISAYHTGQQIKTTTHVFSR